MKDYSEEDENLRLRDPRLAKTSACTRGRSCLRGGCIGKRTEFPAAFCGSSGARSLRFSLRSGRTEQRTPPLPFLMARCLPHKASCYPIKQYYKYLPLLLRFSKSLSQSFTLFKCVLVRSLAADHAFIVYQLCSMFFYPLFPFTHPLAVAPSV